MTFNLVEATNKFLGRKRFRGHSDCHMYPSEASVVIVDQGNKRIQAGPGGCLRSQYYRCTGETGIAPTPRSQSIAEIGKAVENMLVDNWKRMGILVERAVRFQNSKYNLSGELDAVLRDPETGTLFFAEVKSFYGYYAGKEIFGSASVAGKPKVNNLLQSLVYAYEFRNTLSHGKIFYTERGNGEKKSFDISVVLDEEGSNNGDIVYRPVINSKVITTFTVQDIYDRYEQSIKHILDGIIPDREFDLKYSNERVEQEYTKGEISKSKYDKFKKVSKRDGSVRYSEANRPGDFQCSYCPYKNLCWQ